jgi:nucleoside-diphosphate-sugar epimerase
VPEPGSTLAVVGVSGFVGSHVAAALLRAGCTVRGTLRDPNGPSRGWLEREVASQARHGARLVLLPAELRDQDSLVRATRGADGILMCAGTERQAPETVDLMVDAARHALDAAETHGIERVVFLSSTGSTNPPDGEPEVKHEDTAWSDPDQQVADGKYSPAAKTRMEQTALSRMAAGGGVPRVVILNPSLIAGPAFQDDPPSHLGFFRSILAGERWADGAPDGSMSMIDVRDLAAMHLAALDQQHARGRIFAVKRSWHWQDILEALGRVHAAYTPPPWPADRERSRPTRFDFGRRDALGVELRGLDAILEGVVGELDRRGLLPRAG